MLGVEHGETRMSRTKREMEEREQGQYDAAERDGRNCPYCSAVIPYGTELGPNNECPACIGALKDD
jgi:hypothetical protein